MYPRNTAANKNILRVPGLYDVYLNHGESDKAEAVNPATRAFDEIWVVGDAARDRYLAANVGVRAEQLRIVGRPPLGELLAAPPLVDESTLTTVVYAPTWEGYFAEDGYSSLPTMGTTIVAALLARPNTRLIYVPHPAVGTLLEEFALANEAVLKQLRHAGPERAIVAGEQQRNSALASADVLVADIGNELTDFLALNRPYLVVNAGATSAAAFVAANPSAAGGTIVGANEIAAIAEAVTDAVTNDPKRGERASAQTRYLGVLDTPPIERFLSQVDDLLAFVQKTRPRPIDTTVTESASL
jgi:CDP-glycerol glycerophosphotransferase (TagB/SpsB family)